VKIKPIASSSSGCCYVIESNGSQLLLECGIQIEKIRKSLDYDMSKVVACFTSHEHGDHSGYLQKLEISTPIQIYCTNGTERKYHLDTAIVIRPGKIFKPNGVFTVFPVELVHDVQCLGFVISDGSDILFYATDTGKISHRKILGITQLMIEANHSLDLLSASDAEYKDRVMRYHLDIDSVVDFCLKHKKTLKEVHLIHLSDDHSDAKLFENMVAGSAGVPVYVADK